MMDEKRIKKVISEVLCVPMEEIQPDFSSDTAEQWSSLAHLTLIIALEEEFGVHFSDSESVELRSFRKIADCLQSKMKTAG